MNAFDNAHETRATVVIAFDGYNQSVTENVYRALRIGIDSGDCIMEPTMQVRRLTPLECERLMGWPDNHTATGTNGPVSDTNRYKMCGNGVASPVAQWIGEAIMRCRPDAEPRSFMDHYLDQLEAERRSDAE